MNLIGSFDANEFCYSEIVFPLQNCRELGTQYDHTFFSQFLFINRSFRLKYVNFFRHLIGTFLPIIRNIWRAGQAFLRKNLVSENSHANVKVWQVKQETKLISGERFCKKECYLIGWTAMQVHLYFFFYLVYLAMEWLRYQVSFHLLKNFIVSKILPKFQGKCRLQICGFCKK